MQDIATEKNEKRRNKIKEEEKKPKLDYISIGIWQYTKFYPILSYIYIYIYIYNICTGTYI